MAGLQGLLVLKWIQDVVHITYQARVQITVAKVIAPPET